MNWCFQPFSDNHPDSILCGLWVVIWERLKTPVHVGHFWQNGFKMCFPPFSPRCGSWLMPDVSILIHINYVRIYLLMQSARYWETNFWNNWISRIWRVQNADLKRGTANKFIYRSPSTSAGGWPLARYPVEQHCRQPLLQYDGDPFFLLDNFFLLETLLTRW